MADERLSRLLAKARRLPLTPGVYIMKNETGKIIYIGKAKKLQNRVSQYFGTQNRHAEKVRQMVENVEDFDYILCDNEFEALVLECSLIKQNMPKYNILLKDAKGFHYIRVTPPPYTTIKAAKMIKNDGAEYLGPYYSSYVVKRSVDAALKTFKLPQCNKTASDFMKKRGGRPCLNYHIGQCSAPCCNKISRADYDEAASAAVDFLKKGSNDTVKLLTAQMNEAAERLEFERAARLRDQINALKGMGEKQKVVESAIAEQDIIALANYEEKCCVEVFRFRGGLLTDRENFFFDGYDDDSQMRYEFVLGFYSGGTEIPRRLTLDGEVADRELIERFLTEKLGKKVSITIPKKGEQLHLVNMCKENAEEHLADKLGKRTHSTAALDELKKLLGLKKIPRIIESYDISHTAGDDIVAGMVVFKDGVPFKSGYRKFAIKTLLNQDDCAAMAEVIERRILEYKKGEDGYFRNLPDLILLDGGRGQVEAVGTILSKHGIDVALFGLVKDDKHRTRAVVSSSGEIALKSTKAAYTLAATIQEEVHRFAIGYHHKKRSAKVGSSLTKIDGIGEMRAKALLRHFGTIENISHAEIDDILRVKGMNYTAARSIYDYFRKNS
ncbi:MAG: excinuclease ABC subunit UvrC [Clostridia bacterium]|nr:excinuclease ABC subunit UvrC [Clostridia bacterium]